MFDLRSPEKGSQELYVQPGGGREVDLEGGEAAGVEVDEVRQEAPRSDPIQVQRQPVQPINNKTGQKSAATTKNKDRNHKTVKIRIAADLETTRL
eukprot:scaffold130088_cov18-Prasinocladus_malaysianus.AAC.1